MEIYGTSLADLIRQSVRDPRAAARHLFALPLASTVLWQALLLVVVLSVLLFQATVIISGPSPAFESGLLPGAATSPFMLGLIQGSLLVMMVFAIHWVGRSFGGTGKFEGAITLVAWLQFLLICLQLVQIVAMVIMPPLSGLIAILGFVVFFWLLTQFLCELHGFKSAGMVFIMIIVTMLALTFALSILLGIVGLLFLGEFRMYDVAARRAEFPILSREVQGKPLVYLDNGASAQKPQVVIDAVTRAYAEEYANVHRGLHTLSNLATEKYEAVRGTIARFLGAKDEDEIVFTTGTTQAINLVAYGWAMPCFEPGDEIVLSVLEHHANIVPWHFLRERQGAVLRWVEPEADGSLDARKVIDAIGPRTRLVAVTHMSNVLGSVVDVTAIAAAARASGVACLVDGSQAAVHMPVDVEAIGADFYAITGHKLYGPSASGAIHIRKERMAEMRPFIGGGDMIREVHRDAVTYNDPPMKFEAGTPGIVQQIGLGAALDYMMGVGMEAIAAHEANLRDYAHERLTGLNWLHLQGDAPGKGAIFSFTMNGSAHAHDISTVLDKRGVAVRAGHHCAGPLMDHLGVSATCRASFGLYNTLDEIDVLVDALELCHELFD